MTLEQDDAFHLTAVDVRRYEFQVAMRGYERARVDQFKEQVADEMERLMRANQDLDEKARGLLEQLRAFRERDRALNEALISAQQLRADMKEQASREADLIVEEARAEAARVLEAARGEVASVQLQLEQLERARLGYLAQLKALAERHLAEVAAFERQRAFHEGT